LWWTDGVAALERVDPTADAGPIQRGDVITAINNTSAIFFGAAGSASKSISPGMAATSAPITPATML